MRSGTNRVLFTALVASLVTLLVATGAVAAPGSPVLIAKLTGPGSINNTEARFNLKSTDLGIMWEDGQGRILSVFGDSYGSGWTGPGAGQGDPATLDWRCNLLAISTDTNLADGMTIDSMITDRPNHAAQIIPCRHDAEGTGEHTVIPTAGVSVGGRDYIHYMSIRQWTPWRTNHAGIAYSDDGGQTWTVDPNLRWQNDSGFADKFQMVSFVKRDGFVYMFGTPNGRAGAVYVARVAEGSVASKGAYQYWNGATWVGGADSQAAVIVPAPNGEISVQYSEHTGSWLMMHLDDPAGQIWLSEAPAPTGPWQRRRVVADKSEYPALYGGFMHPWSTSTCDLYFTMSQWDPYNVFLMKVPLGSAGSRNTTRVDIPDATTSAPGAAVTSNATNADCARAGSTKAEVEVHLKHTYVGDLKITLRGPNGFSKVLKAPSEADGRVNLDQTFPVDASSTTANGQWQLEIQDFTRLDTGYLESWSIAA